MNLESAGGWEELLREAQRDYPQAREELCRELAVRLRHRAKYRLWGWPRQDQEDVVQECLCTFIQKLDQVETNPQGYACEILRHKIGNALQRRKSATYPLHLETPDNPGRPAFAPVHLPEAEDGFLTQIEKRDSVQRIAEAIENLPDFCRDLFIGLLQERSIQELWGIFQQREPGLHRSAYDKRIFDYRRRLRQLVGDAI